MRRAVARPPHAANRVHNHAPPLAARRQVTPAALEALADSVEARVQGGLSPRPLLSVPHILADESSCYYHGCAAVSFGGGCQAPAGLATNAHALSCAVRNTCCDPSPLAATSLRR